MQIVGLNTRLFTIGNPYDPHLYVWSEESFTGRLRLFDVAGNYIDEMEISVQAQQLKDVLLGDWLDQKIQEEGFYILDVFGTPLTLLAVAASMSSYTPDHDYLRKILVMDKVTGLVTELPPNSPNIPASNRYLVVRYYHNEEEGKGKLLLSEGFATQEIGWARFAVLRQTFTFENEQAMLRFMIRHAWAMDADRTEAIGRIAARDIQKALSIMGLYGTALGLGRMLNYKIDVANRKITVDTLIALGFGWEDVKRGLRYAAAGAIAGAAIGAAVFLTVSTAGAGTIAAGAIVGAGVGFAASLLTSADTPSDRQYLIVINNIYQEGVENVNNAYNKAIEDLNALHQAGEVSDRAYQILKADIDMLYNVALQSLKDVYETAKGGYDAGYNDGYKAGYSKAKSDDEKYIIAAAAGGFIGGVALSK